MAAQWDYLLYTIGADFKNKEIIYISVLNRNGNRVKAGRGTEVKYANAKVLHEFFGAGVYKYKEAYKMDVIGMLGAHGWELIGTGGKDNDAFYFKRPR